jgi:sugar phosphate isomerase/epimerase
MDKQQFMMFSKHLHGVPLEQAAKMLTGIGLRRIDLTVRSGGHVDPEQVENELPRIAHVLSTLGVTIGMITTEISDVHSPLTERVLRTAVTSGIRYYKLGYFRYGGFGTLDRQRREVKAKLRDLAQLNASLGISGGFHNHSDDFLGASLSDIDFVLDGVDPKAIGIYLDPAHAVIEGGSRGWMMGMDLVAPRITMLAVKDFHWVDGKHRYAGGRRQSVEFCPLSQGNTPWPEVLQILKSIHFDGPVSFHSEYQGALSFKDLTVAQVVNQTAEDVRWFERWGAEM